jgi:hypothetical protein
MALDDEARNAAASQEHRCGQPGETTADDENGRARFRVTILTIALVVSTIMTPRQTHWFTAPALARA